MTRRLKGRRFWITCAAAALGLAGMARADSIASGGLSLGNVSIDKIEGDTIYYKTQSGSPTSRAINDKLKINLTDEPSLNEAEEAYGAGRWADAVDGYVKTLKSTNKQWLKDFTAIRLMAAADKANRFDAGIVAWLAMLQRDAKVAGGHKPKLPAESGSTYLKTGLAQLDAAATAEKSADNVMTIRAFELDVARAMKDDAKVAEIAAELSKGSATGSSTASNVQAVVDGQLGLVKVAIDKGDFPQAQQKLDQIKASVADPSQEADWVWLKAEAQAGVLGDSKDASAIQDAALNYMKLVANFPTNAKVPQALMKTAGLLEKANDKPTALAVYQDLARDYSSQPAGKEAQANVDRLKTASNP